MKRFLLPLMAALVALLLPVACSSVSEDERLEYVPLEYEAPSAGVPRGVLIEDFTGQDCPNCPTATDIIGQLHATYGSAIVAVAIHSGPQGVLPTAHPEGLATELGNEYYKYWDISAQPMGVIDRSDGVQNYRLWTAKVRYDVQRQPTAPADIHVEMQLDEAAATATVTASVVAVKDSTVSGRVQLWLVEDSITAYQDMPDGSKNPAYVHNHVLRTSLNGTWGEDVSVADGATQSFTHQVQLSEAWRPEQLAVVAFVYNDEGVVQVVRKQLIGEEPDGPGTPDNPEDPDNPDNPDNPDTPDNPGPPDTPDDPEPPEYDTTFQFEDATGNVVADGTTVVITRMEDGQMNTGLYIRNTSDDDAAGVMLCDISAMPGGTFSSCAFGQCLAPWSVPGEYQSYKSIMTEGQDAQPILTEWVPEAGQYAEWECTFQLCTLDIVTQVLFGITTQKAGDEILDYGPKITVRFVYSPESE